MAVLLSAPIVIVAYPQRGGGGSYWQPRNVIMILSGFNIVLRLCQSANP